MKEKNREKIEKAGKMLNKVIDFTKKKTKDIGTVYKLKSNITKNQEKADDIISDLTDYIFINVKITNKSITYKNKKISDKKIEKLLREIYTLEQAIEYKNKLLVQI